MRNRIISLSIASLLMIASVSALPGVKAQESDWPVGDEWLYYYIDSYPEENYEGFMRYTCVGETAWNLEGMSISVIEFRSSLKGNVSGEMAGLTLSGTFGFNTSEYYDINTGETVAFVSQQYSNIIEEHDFQRNYWNFSEYNVTEYLPPGGFGYEPYLLDIGTSWHKNYSMHSHSNGTIQGADFEEHSNFTDHVKFTFLGYESMTVPAGTYYSSVLKAEYEDGTISTLWYATEVESFVRILESYAEGDTLELTLADYAPYSESPAGTFSIPWYSFVFFAFIGATGVAAIIAEIINRKKMKASLDLKKD